MAWTWERSAVISLLATFAQHLALRAQEMIMLPTKSEAPAITRARDFIAKHQAEKLSLTEASLHIIGYSMPSLPSNTVIEG